jgi:hypothetical protein
MYTFPEKNKIIQAIVSEQHFAADAELFLKHHASHRLAREIRHANQFTRRDLDARMLSELLEKLSEEQILANRTTFTPDTPSTTTRRTSSPRKPSPIKKKQNPRSTHVSPGKTTRQKTSSSASSSTTSASTDSTG